MPRDEENGQTKEDATQRDRYFAPNISLNFQNPEKYSSAVRGGRPRKTRAVAAVFAVAVQTGVLAFFGALTFRLGLSAGAGSPSPMVGFGLTFSGTIFLVLGMFICANVIDQSTLEDIWSVNGSDKKRDEKQDAFELFWLQNRKNEQDGVQSWMLFSDEPHYVIVTSHLNTRDETKASNDVSICFGISIGISGFFMQLFGIRMMHWSAAVAQLGATLTMMVVRAATRHYLAESPESWPLPDKHELDWLAMRLERKPDKPDKPAADNEPSLFRDPGKGRGCKADDNCSFRSGECWKWTAALDRLDCNYNGDGFSKDPKLNDDGQLVFMVRQRLGYMSKKTGKKWTALGADVASAISKVIDDIMGFLLAQKDPPHPHTRFWPMPVCVCDRTSGTKCGGCNQNVYFRVKWDPINQRWKSDLEEIEAYLSLWLFELKQTGQSDSLGYPRRRKLGKCTAGLKDDLRRWAGPEVEAMLELPGADHDIDHTDSERSEERCNDEGTSHDEYNNRDKNSIVLLFEASLSIYCAHQLLFRFLQTVTSDKMSTKIKDNGVLERDNISSSWKDFRLKHNQITNLAQKIKDSGLMSFEHALTYTVAALSYAKKLPDCPDVLKHVRSTALGFKSRRQFSEAADVYRWMLVDYNGGSQGMNPEACALWFVFRQQFRVFMWVMREELPLARDQKAAEDEIESFQTVSAQIEKAWDVTMPDGMVVKLEETLARHLDNERWHDKAGLPKPELDDLGWNLAHYHLAKYPKIDKRLLNQPDLFGRTPLHEVAKRTRSTWLIRSFIDQGADIDAEDEEGKTALHFAAQYGWIDTVEALLFGGASIYKVDSSGKSALHWISHATVLGYLVVEPSDRVQSIGSVMLQFKKLVDLRDRNGRTALHLAAGLYNVLGVVELLKISSSSDVNARDTLGNTPLHVAGQSGRDAIIDRLVKAGAEINAKNWSKDTALHLACRSGHWLVVKELLHHEADYMVLNNRLWPPLYEAAQTEEVKGMELLVEKLAGNRKLSYYLENGLRHAVAKKKEKMVDWLISKMRRDSANSADNKNIRLTGAVLRCYRDSQELETIQRLVQEEDINPLNTLEFLGSVAEARRVSEPDAAVEDQVADLEAALATLIEAGWDPNKLNEWQETALEVMAGHGQVDAVRLVLPHMKGQLSGEKWMKTAQLYNAIESGDAWEVMDLIESEVVIESRNKCRQTPLSRAAELGRKAVVRVLVKFIQRTAAVAQLNTTSSLGMTPLHFAARGGNEGVVQLLVDAGADIDAKTVAGKTALALAEEEGHPKVMDILLKAAEGKVEVDVEQI
jgi:ankyrin repeat protein